MRKFSANYVVSETGAFLKNGIVLAEEDGNVIQYIDTTNDLKEIAQLSFHNGILIAGCTFSRTVSANQIQKSDDAIFKSIKKWVETQTLISLNDLINFGKRVQEDIPEMKISDIISKISEVLISGFGFVKETQTGVFLLTGVDLPQLHFTPKAKIKRIL